MAPRLELQTLLEGVLGNNHVYFQPPSSVQMVYPCIVYERDDIRTEYAGNKPYSNRSRYMVTVIDRNPDSLIPGKIAVLPLCTFDRHYVADNLNHDVFNLYF
jgi:hypothetical protein